jgi:hypothetical protein
METTEFGGDVMKRNFAFAAVLVAVALALSSRPARADNGAVVVNDLACVVLAGDCKTFEISPESHEVQTSLATSGNAMLSCKLDLPAGAPLPAKGAAHCDNASTGIFCTTSSGTTTDWKETVSASGHVTLTCHINGQP